MNNLINHSTFFVDMKTQLTGGDKYYKKYLKYKTKYINYKNNI